MVIAMFAAVDVRSRSGSRQDDKTASDLNWKLLLSPVIELILRMINLVQK
jgi:hypothetical protein